MIRNLFTMAFFLGVAAVVWVGLGFMAGHVLALLMTAIIGAVYVVGWLELRQFRQASVTLANALEAIPDELANLGDWLGKVPASLQNPVRLRVEGERIALPGPALTPYLVGLLVMLGMLGTFLGMVVTLNGAAFSLEGTTDLQAIRAALAAPIKGLGLSFGTSVAGVATSAMLGLMSALCRRERLLVAQQLDSQIATRLRRFSLNHQRQQTYQALQFQAQALPEVVDKLQAMMVQMAQLSVQVNERLVNNQEGFHREVKSLYSDLALSVDQSLKASLSQSAQVAGDSLKPVLEAAMAGMAQESRALHARVIASAQIQLDGLATQLSTTTATVTQSWTAALANHERTSAGLVSGVAQSLGAFAKSAEQQAASLLEALQDAHTSLLAEQATAERQRLDAWTGSLQAMAAKLSRDMQHNGAQTLAQQQQICSTLSQTAQDIGAQAQASARQTLGEVARLVASSEQLMAARIASDAQWSSQHSADMAALANHLRAELSALREEEAHRGHAAVARLAELQTAVSSHLATLGSALEDPITRLIETASAAPRAAAELIGQLRQEMSNSIARDNELLEERSRILDSLNSLLGAIHLAAQEQRTAVGALVASSAAALDQVGNVFADKVGIETAKLSDIAAHVTSSAVEVASLGESFGFAVQAFTEGNDKLVGNLQRIEAAMDKSMARSDDQLAYYVAQAREIIDLSVMSQKEVFEELRQLAARQTPLADEVS